MPINYFELITTPAYSFLTSNERLGANIALLTLGGSHAYGTNVEGSDIDIRGIAVNSRSNILLGRDFEQVEDRNTDTVIYSCEKFVKLASACNPNVIEALGCKDEHYIHLSTVGKTILAHKQDFLSQKAAGAFGGYATAQFRRLGNKEARDRSAEVIERHIKATLEDVIAKFNDRYHDFPEGAIKVYVAPTDDKETSELKIDVSLTNYPLRDYRGLLSEMTEIVNTFHKNSKRNEYAADKGKLSKHAMHLIRLYIMGTDILEKGEIITYREKEHDLLMDIRNGKYQGAHSIMKPEFFELVKDMEARFNEAKRRTILPPTPNHSAIDRMMESINASIVESGTPAFNNPYVGR